MAQPWAGACSLASACHSEGSQLDSFKPYKRYKTYNFMMTYTRRDSGNLLSVSDLAYIRSLESDVKALPAYRQLCDTAEPKYKVRIINLFLLHD